MNCVNIVWFLVLLPFCIGNVFDKHFEDDSDCYDNFKTNCCEGYQLINGECIPICQNGCPKYENCLAPNHCGLKQINERKCGNGLSYGHKNYCGKCYPLYVPTGDKYSYNSSCLPYCEQNCTNGFCELPGVCKCDPGYRVNPKTKNCEAIDDSFITLTTNVSSNCQSECSDCICVGGFYLKQIPSTKNIASTLPTPTNQKCEDNCENGICNENGLCKCNPGYIRTYGPACASKCYRECRNGICVPFEESLCLKRFSPKPAGELEFYAIAEKTELPLYAIYLLWMVGVITLLIAILVGYFTYRKVNNSYV